MLISEATMATDTQSPIAAAMAEIQQIECDSKNEHGGYRYASADAV